MKGDEITDELRIQALQAALDQANLMLIEQREWVGLTETDYEEIEEWVGHVVPEPVFYATEAKLREKNGGGA